MDAHPLIIDAALVRSLVDTQFPHWKSLPIRPVAQGGWDNRTFHLGDQMLVRLPSTAEYAPNVAKERQWLPLLAPQLPLPIPVPLAQGKPTEAYPFPWSIYQWLDGASAAQIPPADKNRFAHDLAQFLTALWRINAPHGPRNLYRESLARYDAEAAQAITLLKDTIDTRKAALIWQKARATSWNKPAALFHGDISLGNLLVNKGRLCAVIDFGGLGLGDPACDLAIAWTFFDSPTRQTFLMATGLDEATWSRGRAWALWKALIVAARLCETNNVEGEQCWKAIDTILAKK